MEEASLQKNETLVVESEIIANPCCPDFPFLYCNRHRLAGGSRHPTPDMGNECEV
jgi:hypothetical protein